MPESWQTAIICPIPPLKVCFKVLTNTVHRWLVHYEEEILGDYQCGFRKG
jgi:hypothetical protein